MQSLEQFLTVCAETERMASDFYASMARAFRGRPCAAEAFRGMSEDEANHARTFDMLRSLAARQRMTATIHKNFYKNVERMRRGIECAANTIESDSGFQLTEAIGLGLLIEATTIERDKASFIEVDDPQFRKTLRGLISADERHLKKLEELRDAKAA
jgi:rubrerythrin